MSKNGFQPDVPEPRPGDGYGRAEHRPKSKDQQWVYPMPKIAREYVERDGARFCRFVTEWVEVDEDSAPECYVRSEGE